MQSHVVARPRPGVAPSNAKHVVLRALPVTARSRSAWHSRGNLLTCSSSAASPSAPGGDPANSNLPADTSTSPNTSPGLLGRIKRFFLGDKLDKEKLAQLGMGAFASYGFISNVTYGICLGTAWISFVKATGKSPLAAGQWPAFLGFYAGLWTVQNFVRPLRFSLAIALAPVFERIILWISRKTGLSKRWAFGLYLVCFAVVTATLLFGTIYLLGGFPPSTP